MTPIGPLMIFLRGTRLSATERDLLRHPAVGGVIFFPCNYNNKEQLSNLISEIKAIAPQLILATDHEGGRVQRFKQDFTHLPPMRRFGELFEKKPEQALRLIYANGRLAAQELHAVGIDTGFSPVLDLFGNSDVIGDRALHTDPNVVVKLARAFIEGLYDGGILPVGKHFPGHGTVAGDTHDSAVEDRRTLEQIEATDLAVFRDLIADKDSPLAAVMAAHVIYSQVDALPAGLSGRWLKEILRDDLGFNGIIFSDDLAMRGVRTGGRVSVKQMLKAGCDMVLICRDPQLLQDAIGELSDNEINDYANALGQRWEHRHRHRAGISTRKDKVNWDADAARKELHDLAGQSGDH